MLLLQAIFTHLVQIVGGLVVRTPSAPHQVPVIESASRHLRPHHRGATDAKCARPHPTPDANCTAYVFLGVYWAYGWLSPHPGGLKLHILTFI